MAYGHQPRPVFVPAPDTPAVTFVAEDVDRAWDEIGPHLFHDARMYAQWDPDNQTSAGFTQARDVAELRATATSHRIVGVEEAVRHVSAGEMLNLSPLCGGLAPELAWPYLELVGEVVIPAAARTLGTSGGDGMEEALTELISTRGSKQ
jgi:hypothetical protein